ncbi:AB hydrolase superfamily protein [Pleurotus pulmonarius]
MSLRPSTLTLLFLTFFAFVSATTTSKIVISADGTQIYADATGDPEKQSIVFVHGLALSSIVFDRLFANKRLADYHLVRYDMRGHGRSDKPATADAHTSIRYSQDFAAVVNAFGLKKPIFVGWSPGGKFHKTTRNTPTTTFFPLWGAVALGGSPGLNLAILPIIASPVLLGELPGFTANDNVTAALATRQPFIDGLFQDPAQVDFRLKAEYLGQTVVQSPAISALVSTRSQDLTKLFAAGEASFPCSVLAPHFGDKLFVSKVPGGHALFDDNPEGLIDQLMWFVQKTTESGNSARSTVYSRRY